MIRQEIIRDIKYDGVGDITYYKTENFKYLLPSNNVESSEEQEFIDIMKSGIIKSDEIHYPNCIFLFKNGKCLFRYDLKNGIIWFNYMVVWLIFETKYLMECYEIQNFMGNMMEKHFNCEGLITCLSPLFGLNKIERVFQL